MTSASRVGIRRAAARLAPGVLALVVCGVVAAAGQTTGPPAPAAEAPPLPARLVYGGDRAFPPFEYLDDDGQPQGFNVELVRALAERLGVRIDIELAPWPEIVARFDRHEVDLVSMAYSDLRDARYALLAPRTWTLDQAVVFKPGRDTYPNRLDLLQNETVAVEDASVMRVLLDGLPEVQRPAVVGFESQQTALAALADGQATAVAGNALTLRYWARQAGLDDLVSVPVKSIAYHLATQKDRAAAFARVADALAAFRDSDGIDRLVERYLVVQAEDPVWHRYAAYLGVSALVAAMLLVGVVGWNRSLARQVERRTVELRDSEERYRDLFEHANDLIQSLDPDGRFLFVNRSWLRTLGYDEEEVRSLTFLDIVHPDSLEHCQRLFARVHAGEQIGTVRADFLSKAGRRITVEGSVNAKVAKGRIVATRAIFRDVTARQVAEDALRASEARSRSLIHNMLGGLVTLDEDGLIETINTAGERIFGYEAGALVGQHVSVLIPESLRGSSPRFLQEAFRDAIGRITEWEGRRKNGETFPLELSFFEFRDGDGRHFAGNIRDIAERREVDRLKNEFVSTVSHELRTPLTSIKGAMQLLLHDESTTVSAELRQLVDVALNNTERLIRIVNDMLDVAKIEAGRLNLQRRRVAVGDLVRTSVENVEQIARGAGVRIVADVADGLPDVCADPDRIVQALVNLLSNALKFAPAGSDVTIAARPVPGGLVSLAVSDRGPGIPPGQLPRLFEKFQQLDRDSARKSHGTGLGLVITRGLVEQHGGRIEVTSAQGEGTTFRITLAGA